MEKAAIQQMLKEHEAELGRMQAAMLRIQGAIACLREQLRMIDEAKAESEADDGAGE